MARASTEPVVISAGPGGWYGQPPVTARLTMVNVIAPAAIAGPMAAVPAAADRQAAAVSSGPASSSRSP